MTRAQYVAFAIVAAVAVLAYVQSYQVAQALRRSTFSGTGAAINV